MASFRNENDTETLVQEALFRGFLNDPNNCHFRRSGEILKATWDISVTLISTWISHSNEAYIWIKCNNLKRRVFVKGKILFEEENSIASTEKQFQNLFGEGENSFAFIVQNIKAKNILVSCELQIYASLENAFYLTCKRVIRPSVSDTDRVLQSFQKRFDQDFLTLYQGGQFSDATFQCESEMFKVHKCVVSVRSKVIVAMFQNPMKESETNVVEIKNISPDTLQVLLKYIYLNEVPNFSATSPYDLLAAAEMYDLPELKAFCVLTLQSRLSVDNVLFTLIFADLYDKDLKEICVDYICEKFYHLKKTPEWVVLQKEKPFLANEVLKNLFILVNRCCNKVGEKLLFC